MTAKIEPGCRARTNSRYAQRVSAVPREMTVVKPYAPIDGAWYCDVDGLPKRQIFHENYLERAS